MKKALKSIFATVLVIAVAMSIVISFSRECVSVAKKTGNKPGKVSGLSVSYDTSGDNLLTTIKWKKAKKARNYSVERTCPLPRICLILDRIIIFGSGLIEL